MNKAKKSNRPLILSIISIMLCTLLLIGSTIAWFTDTETNKGNTIEAGTLDIIAQWYDVDTTSNNTAYTIGDYSFKFSSTANDFAKTDDSMIDEENWQSGDVNAKLVEVINNGTLDVNIDLNAVATDLGLEDSLWFDFVAVDATTTTGTFTVRAMSSLSDVVSGYSTTLTAGNSVQFILIYGMLESAGNTYQTDMSEEIATSFTADIIVTATQTNTKEETVVYASTVEDINKAKADQTVILMQNITSTTAVNLEDKNVNFDLNGYTLKVPSFTMSTSDYCTVDIANGTIITTVGNIDIQIPNGTINVGNTSLASTGEHIFDASQHTLNLTGTTQLVGVTDDNGTPVADTTTKTATIMDNTRVVVDTYSSVYLQADTAAENVILENSATGEETPLTDEPTEASKTTLVSTIDELKDALLIGAKIILEDNITDKDAKLYTSAEDTTIDLNGYTLDITYLVASVDTNLTLVDSEKTGSINSDASCCLISKGTVEVDGVNFTGYKGVEVIAGSDTTINNSTFNNSYISIHIFDDLTLSNTIIDNEYLAICHVGGEIDVVNCEIQAEMHAYYSDPSSSYSDVVVNFEACKLEADGDATVRSWGGNINIEDCEIISEDGKGIYLSKDTDGIATNLVFTSGSITSAFSSIYQNWGTVTIEDGELLTTGYSGGGASTIYQTSAAGKLTINGGTIKNTYKTFVSALETYGEVEINDGEFTLDYKVTSSGSTTVEGLLQIKSGASVTINGGIFNYCIDLEDNYYSWSTTKSISSTPNAIIDCSGELTITGGTFNCDEQYYASEDILTTITNYLSENSTATATKTRATEVSKQSTSLQVVVSEKNYDIIA